MAFLNDEAWQGKVYSGGWIASGGGDAAVIEPPPAVSSAASESRLRTT